MAYSEEKIKHIGEYHKQHGTDLTLKQFNIQHATLDRLLRKFRELSQVQFDFERDESDNEIALSLKSHELKTVDELLKYSKIDTTIWEPHKVVTNAWGSATNPCYQIKVWLRKIQKDDEININDLCNDIINTISSYAPPSVIKRKKDKDAFLWEVGLVDHHLGQFSWEKEVGFNYDIKIAEELFHEAIDFLIDKIKPYNIGKILYHFGQDFYNVNGQFNNTVAGTAQVEEGRWQKSFNAGTQLHIDAINKLKKIADVDAVQIKGNHDEERIFYAGAVLEAWFSNDKNVNIDNRPMSRKYYQYGKNLIGLSHAEGIPIDRLLGLMPIEAKEMWAECCHYVWRLGHLHHNMIKKPLLQDKNGIRVTNLPTLTPVDAWHFNKGYLHSRETQSFLHHPEKGNMIQINYRV